ncbi:MAG: hypothetical protein NZ743_10965, partial [Pseudomonadales bacterium]|nr:hypothetical protein [Pseudomonadales bacterium]
PPPPHAARYRVTIDQIPSRTIFDKANMLCYPAPTECVPFRATIARSPKQSTEVVDSRALPQRENSKMRREWPFVWNKVLLAVALVLSIARMVSA